MSIKDLHDKEINVDLAKKRFIENHLEKAQAKCLKKGHIYRAIDADGHAYFAAKDCDDQAFRWCERCGRLLDMDGTVIMEHWGDE